MADLKKYSFKRYDKNYNNLFRRAKYRLRKIISGASIEHIGSTAVPKLGGKGIIDIVVSVQKNEIKRTIKKLEKNGFEFKPSGGDKDRKFLQKIIRYSRKERRVHIQLTHNNSKTWKSMIALREYLKKHDEAAREYALIKKEAVRYAKGDGKKYRKYKKSFLEKLEKNALKEYNT